MQFSTRQINFYTLLRFLSFDARTSTLYLTEMRTLHSIPREKIILSCRYSLRTAFCQSPRQISNSTSYIFNSTFEFLLPRQWSLVETKEASVGVRDGDRSTSSPGSLVHHLCEKGSQLATHDLYLKPKCCLLCWNVKLFTAAIEGLRFFNLLQSAFWIWITQRFSFVREFDDFLKCFAMLKFKVKRLQVWRIALWLS